MKTDKQIKKEWKKSSVKNQIIFLGYVDRQDLKEIYSLASLFVYPSFYEGFGFPPLEAMAASCPTIVSSNSSLPEVTRGGALLISPNNIEESVMAIKSVLTQDDLRQKLIRKGQTISSDYRWKNVATKYIDLFNNIY